MIDFKNQRIASLNRRLNTLYHKTAMLATRVHRLEKAVGIDRDAKVHECKCGSVGGCCHDGR